MNVASGFHVIPPDYKEVLKKIEEGYKFIGFSLDTLFLGKSCKESLVEIRANMNTD
jgi:2-dehydro-3-deoxyglucarate aldolase